MRAWADKPGFSAVAGALKLDAQTQPELARQAAAAYADSGDFTLLYVVTSSWALRHGLGTSTRTTQSFSVRQPAPSREWA